MVDEHAGEPVADGPLDQRRGDRRVHPAGQAADGPAVADLRPDRRHLLLDDVEHGPGRAAAGQLEEAGQDALAVLGVHDLGVELDAEQALGRVLHRGHRGGLGPRGHGEAGRGRGGGVAVGHPDALRLRRAGQQGAVLGGLEGGGAVLGGAGALDGAAEAVDHQLEAVAEAEDGDARVEQAFRGGRGAVGVDRRGAAGQDDRLGVLGQHLGGGHGGGDDLGVDVALPHPAGDQLRVLRAEVDDEDGVEASGHADHLSLRAFDGIPLLREPPSLAGADQRKPGC